MSDLVGNPIFLMRRLNYELEPAPMIKFVSNSEYQIQVSLIITLSLGSMETDRVIGEPCYNEVIYNMHIAK